MRYVGGFTSLFIALAVSSGCAVRLKNSFRAENLVRAAADVVNVPLALSVATSSSLGLQRYPTFDVAGVALGESVELLVGTDLASCSGGTSYATGVVDTVPFSITATRTLSETSTTVFQIRVVRSDGSIECREAPAHTNPIMSDITQLALGALHTCALVSDQSVRCWGSNGSGQLGDGTMIARSSPVEPSTVHGLRVSALFAGGNSTCAIMQDQTATCWGEIDIPYGQMPALVTEIAVGANHVCFGIDDGSVVCAGSNTRGEMGSATAGMAWGFPAYGITIPDRITNIAAGGSSTCAVADTGTVYCWGYAGPQNGSGTVGTGSDDPIVVTGLGFATSITMSAGSACARTEDGSGNYLGTYCWGHNPAGNLGDGTTTPSATPVLMNASSEVSAVATGESHACALLSDSTIECVGENSLGQLGDETLVDSLSFVVPNVRRVSAIYAYENRTCALFQSGTAQCWGESTAGALGDGFQNRLPFASHVDFAEAYTRVVAGTSRACAIKTGGKVDCWGTDLAPVEVASLANVQSLAIQGANVCALLGTGKIACWGTDNSYGELGDGTTGSQASPTEVVAVSGAVSVALGTDHGCAALDTGEVKCWGRNTWGMLGNSSFVDSLTAVTVTGIANAVEVVAGAEHSCALLDTGRVKCWGSRSSWQDGSGGASTSTPVFVPGVLTARSISSIYRHTCAVLDDDTVTCWGKNSNGQSLSSMISYTSSAPTTVAGLSNVDRVVTGVDASCALLKDGTAKCWGSNAAFQLGDGTDIDRAAAVTVLGVVDATDIAMAYDAGGIGNFAIGGRGTVKHWGKTRLDADSHERDPLIGFVLE